MPAEHPESLRPLIQPALLLAGFCLALGAPAAETAVTAPPSVPPPLVGRPLSERPVLVVGATTDNYPYGYLDAGGVWTGFSSDLLNALADVMKLRISRVDMPGEALRERFRNGDFDFLQALSQTPEREKYADFSVPYLTLQGAIFVRKDGRIKSIGDFQGQKFAVTGRDTIGALFFEQKGVKFEPVLINSTEEGLRLVDAGQCAGVYVSNLTALSVIDRVGLRNVVKLDVPITNHDIRHCFAVHKGDAQLLARLNEGLAILHRTGEFDRIYERWFGRFDSPVISRQQVVTYAVVGLTVALAVSLWGYFRQRALRRRIAGQAAELSGQQALLQALYDNVPMAMAVLTAEPGGYRVLSINRQAEAWFGAPAAKVAGRRLEELVLEPEWLAHLVELLVRGFAARTHLREERRLANARRRLIFTLVPMTAGPAGQPRLCVLAEDITERRNLDEEIAQSRKLRAVGELVGGIAHEFNNLLTPIMLQVGQIQLEWRHDQRLLEETRLIAEAVQRSSELTHRLLTFGRKADHQMQEVHLGSIVSNAFSLLRLTMDRRILWEQAVPADLPPFHFSATDLNQIILNLIINARDTLLEKLAAQPGEWTPLIRVEACLLPADKMGRTDGTPTQRRIQGWQRLTIRDNGMGMTPEVRERIFEPFFTTKDVGKGTGLGLATVWHLVTEVSGRIEVESTPGVGTAFHLYLPMLPSPAAGSAAASVPRSETRQSRIFLAEDDLLVAGAVCAALKRAGHNVTHLPDGAAAWTHLQERMDAYDLLLLDVNMPGLDGIELARRVRNSGRYAGRIMITSGRLSSNDLREIGLAKVDQVLNKPFDIGELLAAIRTCLSSVPKP